MDQIQNTHIFKLDPNQRANGLVVVNGGNSVYGSTKNGWLTVQGDTPLPSTGKHSFKIKVDKFGSNFCVGVCKRLPDIN